MAEIPSTEPASLRVGDSWRWLRADLSDYPAPGWALTYALRNAASHLDLTAIAEGTAHLIAVPAVITATYTAGRYDWYAFASDGMDRHQIGSGIVELLPNVALSAAHDGRAWARRMLDLVESALEGRATTDQLDLLSTQLGDKTLTRDRAGLLTLRSDLLLEVKRAEGTGGKVRTINARFG